QSDVRVPPPDVQRADALWPIHFVRREAQQVNTHRLDIKRQLAGGLYRVGVEQDAALLAPLADLSDGLERADLVVRRHDADEDRFFRKSVGNLLGGDPSVFVHWKERHLKAGPFEAFAWIEDRVMLGSDGDDVIAVDAVHRRHALDGQIVALGRAAGEDDLA